MTLPFDPARLRANVPAELQSRPKWLLWQLKQVPGKKKPTKVPHAAKGGYASSTDPATWCSLEEALAALGRRRMDGLGFVFSGDGLVGVDLDHCRDAETGAIDPWATHLLADLASYTEVSPSGTGVHVIVRGVLVGRGRKRSLRSKGAHPEAAIEIYDRARFFTVTGARLPEYPAGIEDRKEAVERLYASMDTKATKAVVQPPPRQPEDPDDDQILRRAIGARNGASFLRLWSGDTSEHGGDDSAADLALCSHLAFWCRGDMARMDRLFRRSRLYREKWDRQDYRERTLAKALEGRTDCYEPARPAAPPARKTSAPTAPEPWQPPVPFDAVTDLPPFPTEAFPVSVADWIRAEAISTQTPEDLPGMIALSVLATAVAKKYRATIRPEWVEPLNVYTEVTLPPGERKSAVFRDATAPLLDWERDAVQREGPRLRESALSLELAEGRLKSAKVRAIKARGADRLVEEEEVRNLSEDVAALPRVVASRVLADDVTPERLFGLLTEQGGRLGILSPEGGIFDLLAGRYSDGLPNLDAFLKAHSGDQLRVDRIGRPAEHLREPALTVGLAVQPAVIEGLADRPGFRGRGLLARFLYSVPRSLVGRRCVDPPPVPVEVTAAYAAAVRALLDLPADRGEDGEIVSRPLPFSPEAVGALLRFSGEIEPRLAEGEDLEPVRDWAAKLPGAVARIAGILTLTDGAGSGGPGRIGGAVTVPLEAVERAILLAQYLIPHALAAFGLMGTQKELEDARYILRWILRGHRKSFTKRDAWQGTRARFDKAEDLDPPLEELEARGYIRRDPDDLRPGKGRKPSPAFTVHPQVHARPHGASVGGANSGNCGNSGIPVCSTNSEEQPPSLLESPTIHWDPSGSHNSHNTQNSGEVAGHRSPATPPPDPDAPATSGHSTACDCTSCAPTDPGDAAWEG